MVDPELQWLRGWNHCYFNPAAWGNTTFQMQPCKTEQAEDKQSMSLISSSQNHSSVSFWEVRSDLRSPLQCLVDSYHLCPDPWIPTWGPSARVALPWDSLKHTIKSSGHCRDFDLPVYEPWVELQKTAWCPISSKTNGIHGMPVIIPVMELWLNSDHSVLSKEL